MNRWQDDVTLEEWEEWQDIARNASHGRNRSSVNSSQDLASLVMEKLLKATERPPNVEAWIRRATETTFIDLWRTRTPIHKVDIDAFNADDDEIFARQVTETLMGPKSAYIFKESIREILAALPEQHQQIILMAAAGFKSQEIAEELGYANRNVVSNQLRRIKEDLALKYPEYFN